MWYLIFLLTISQGGQSTLVTGQNGQPTIQSTGGGEEGDTGTIIPPRPPVKPVNGN